MSFKYEPVSVPQVFEVCEVLFANPSVWAVEFESIRKMLA